jgi:PAS domain S-box-containing protein
MAPQRPPPRLIVRYGFAAATVALAFGIRKVLEPVTGTGAPFVLFFAALLATSLWAGAGPGLFATVLSLVLGAYVFVLRAGFSWSQTVAQAALFAVDGVVVVYLSFVVTRARRAAEISEARRRDLIELAPEAVFLADLDGRFTDVNQTACRMLGYEREELIGKTITELLAPEDVPRLAAVRAQLLVPGQVHRAEWTQRRKDGTLILVEVSSNVLSGGRWQAFVRDVSERRRIEDERQVFVSLLENSSDFIGIADPSGKPIYLNPAGRRLVGLPADYPVEKTEILDYYSPDQRAFASQVILKAMTERGRWSGETCFRHWQTEEAIPVSDEHFMIRDRDGQRVVGMGTVTRDISEARRMAREREELLAREQLARHQAEEANAQLRFSEARFSGIISISADAIISVDEEERIVLFNEGAERIFGFSPAEAIGASLDLLIPERFRPEHPQHVASFAGGETDWSRSWDGARTGRSSPPRRPSRSWRRATGRSSPSHFGT